MQLGSYDSLCHVTCNSCTHVVSLCNCHSCCAIYISSTHSYVASLDVKPTMIYNVIIKLAKMSLHVIIFTSSLFFRTNEFNRFLVNNGTTLFFIWIICIWSANGNIPCPVRRRNISSQWTLQLHFSDSLCGRSDDVNSTDVATDLITARHLSPMICDDQMKR